jgi:hypothetical protein
MRRPPDLHYLDVLRLAEAAYKHGAFRRAFKPPPGTPFHVLELCHREALRGRKHRNGIDPDRKSYLVGDVRVVAL